MPLNWEEVFTLTTPRGVLPFNDNMGTDERFLLLDPAKCSAGPVVRAEADDVPQGPGSILHDQFLSGFTIRLGIELWLTHDTPACDQDLREMWDEFMGHVNALVNPSLEDWDAGLARLSYDVPGDDDRLYDRLKLLSWVEPELGDGGVWACGVTFHTPFPYAITASQITTHLVGGAGILDTFNRGNSEMFPVWRVYGPIDVFQVRNYTTDVHFSYDSSLPGAEAIGPGDYAEIGTFANTVYLNGNQDSLKAGIIVDESEFFPLDQGENRVSLIGDCEADMLWNYAWVS